MILLVENRDSFTFNLVQLLAELGHEVVVRSSRELDVAAVRALAPERVVIGPGPGRPREAGCSESLVRELGPDVAVLGVCLGHQAIGTAFGARLVRSSDLAHGQTRAVEHDGEGVFRGVPSPFFATRYNSLALEEASLPAELVVSARTEHGEVAALRHRSLPLEGVQFHPEAILSEHGRALLANFAGAPRRRTGNPAPG